MRAIVESLLQFYPPWLGAVAIAQAAPVADAAPMIVMFDGLAVPVLQLGLALLGVLLARPLAPRRTPPLGLFKQLLVTVIMLVLVSAWVIESRPGLLFAFVVAIGLGFSGYSLIELIGREVEEFIKRAMQGAADTISGITGKTK